MAFRLQGRALSSLLLRRKQNHLCRLAYNAWSRECRHRKFCVLTEKKVLQSCLWLEIALGLSFNRCLGECFLAGQGLYKKVCRSPIVYKVAMLSAKGPAVSVPERILWFGLREGVIAKCLLQLDDEKHSETSITHFSSASYNANDFVSIKTDTSSMGLACGHQGKDQADEKVCRLYGHHLETEKSIERFSRLDLSSVCQNQSLY